MAETPWILLPLSRGLFAKIDAADAETVCAYKWSANQTTKGRFYAQRREPDGTNVYLHRLLAGAGPKDIADHRNGDTLDCRRANLRLATPSQSTVNTPKRDKGKTPYRGVMLRPSGRYQARININGEQTSLGRFDTAEEAARAYDAAAVEKHGEFAVLNFPKMKAA